MYKTSMHIYLFSSLYIDFLQDNCFQIERYVYMLYTHYVHIGIFLKAVLLLKKFSENLNSCGHSRKIFTSFLFTFANWKSRGYCSDLLLITRNLFLSTSNHYDLNPSPTKKVFILSLNICIELILVVWLKSHEFFFSKFNASTDVLLVKNCGLLNVKILVYHSCKNLKVQCQQIFHLRIILIIHVNF